MKVASILVFALAASAAPAAAQDCRQCADAIRVTVNFQSSLPIDKDAPGEIGKALSGASQPLYEAVGRQCEVFAAAYKGECRVVELNVNASINDRRLPQFVAPGGVPQQRVNANANAVLEITPAAAGKTAPKP